MRSARPKVLHSLAGRPLLQHVLDTVRTGRANTALIEHLHVTHYGQSMPLNQLATLSAPEAQLLTIQPWDQSSLNSIMKAIQTSDLGINPSSDGRLIRLPVHRHEIARRALAIRGQFAVRHGRDPTLVETARLLDVSERGLVLVETAPGVTVAEVRAANPSLANRRL